MAVALEAAWGEDLDGLVITRDGYTQPTRAIQVVEAAHPVPDARGIAATEQIWSASRPMTRS